MILIVMQKQVSLNTKLQTINYEKTINITYDT